MGRGLWFFVFLLLAFTVIVAIIYSQIRKQDFCSKGLKTQQGFGYVQACTN